MTKKQKPKRSWKMWAMIWPNQEIVFPHQTKMQAEMQRATLFGTMPDVKAIVKIKQVTVTEGWE